MANNDLVKYPNRPSMMVNLSIGDPNIYNDFKPNPEILCSLSESVTNNNGYVDFAGIKVVYILIL